ncbi:MAG: LamB/YcsF family protein, partial [Gammaproteobacteria bacterium]|nr:LamB/YcsF family protein [Gammaproteobacteria bacterium]
MLINCDLGECLTPNPDTDIMPLINMANIACGRHVGDDKSMVNTIQLAKQNNVKIGAHPSYADKANFGRISHDLSAEDLHYLIYDQVVYFQTLCHQQGAKLEYIKPHGA